MSGNATSQKAHHVRIEAQTWNNVPPYSPHTMYRPVCKCGWAGVWHSYKENVPRVCPRLAELLTAAAGSAKENE